MLFSVLMAYSFDHVDEREQDQPPLIDTTDIDDISIAPEHGPDTDLDSMIRLLPSNDDDDKPATTTPPITTSQQPPQPPQQPQQPTSQQPPQPPQQPQQPTIPQSTPPVPPTNDDSSMHPDDVTMMPPAPAIVELLCHNHRQTLRIYRRYQPFCLHVTPLRHQQQHVSHYLHNNNNDYQHHIQHRYH